MRGIRNHPLTQPVVVLVALLLSCLLVWQVLVSWPYHDPFEGCACGATHTPAPTSTTTTHGGPQATESGGRA